MAFNQVNVVCGTSHVYINYIILQHVKSVLLKFQLQTISHQCFSSVHCLAEQVPTKERTVMVHITNLYHPPNSIKATFNKLILDHLKSR